MPIIAAIAALLLACVPQPASAQLRAEVIVSGLSSPIAFVQDPVYSDTFYIVEQGGLVRVLIDGQLQATPFIDLRGETREIGERGLLGMAFSRDGRVFFNFTNLDGHTVIARFRRDPGAPRRAAPSSRFDLLWPSGERFIRQPFAQHNGGHLAFGPDGLLYIGLGDGGAGNDPFNLAQDPTSLLGKMLRIDVNVDDEDAVGYRVPSSNPFVDSQPVAARPEIWSFGFRNPWRYSFDDVGPGATGTLFIGDVGEGAREEINAEVFGAGGHNYGWRIREGRIATPGVPPTAPAYGPLTDPILDYPRTEGRAVTGGYVYRGSGLGAAYRGRYFFADFIRSRVWSLGWAIAGGEVVVTDVAEHTSDLGADLGRIASFARDGDGELYLLTFSGRVLKIVGDADSLSPPQNLTANVDGQTVTLAWTPPAAATTIAGYQLEAGSAPGLANLAIVAAAPTQTALSFAGVPEGTYYVRVRTLGASGTSDASNEIVVIVGDSPSCSAAPQPPAALAASVNGRVVTLTWTSSAGANAASEFRLEAGSASGLADLAVLALSGNAGFLVVQAPPGTYFVRIRGVNDCGTSGPSNEIVVSVP